MRWDARYSINCVLRRRENLENLFRLFARVNPLNSEIWQGAITANVSDLNQTLTDEMIPYVLSERGKVRESHDMKFI